MRVETPVLAQLRVELVAAAAGLARPEPWARALAALELRVRALPGPPVPGRLLVPRAASAAHQGRPALRLRHGRLRISIAP
jgi:hypothetical protein